MSCLEYSTMTYLLANGFLSFEKRFLSAFNSNSTDIYLYRFSALAKRDWILTISNWDELYWRGFWLLFRLDLSFMSITNKVCTFAAIVSNHRVVFCHWMFVEDWYIGVVYDLIDAFAKKALKLLESLYLEILVFHCPFYHNNNVLSKHEPLSVWFQQVSLWGLCELFYVRWEFFHIVQSIYPVLIGLF